MLKPSLRAAAYSACALMMAAAQALAGAAEPAMSLPDSASEAYQNYRQAKSPKAFAISASGQHASSENQSKLADAVRAALSNCRRLSNAPCQLYAVNDELQTEREQQAQQQAEQLLAKAATKNADYLLLEQYNWLLDEASQPRPHDYSVHYPTPVSLAGIPSISTDNLLSSLREKRITLIDATGLAGLEATLPGALLLEGAALHYRAKDEALNQKLLSALEPLLAKRLPDKTQAIAVFCTNFECWMSINTLFHLKQLGYQNLYWYRGGVAAWKTAGLEMGKNNGVYLLEF